MSGQRGMLDQNLISEERPVSNSGLLKAVHKLIDLIMGSTGSVVVGGRLNIYTMDLKNNNLTDY